MRWLAPLFDLIFPPRCLLCDCVLREDSLGLSVCQVCALSFLKAQSCCTRCAYPLPEGAACQVCRGRKLAFEAACAVSLYKGGLKKSVHHYKYRNRKHLAGAFGRLIAYQVRNWNWPDFSAVVPVPLHGRRLQERGYDQALLLARAVGMELQLPVQSILVRSRYTPSQTRLGGSERWENVRGAFNAPGKVSGRVLVVDDLLTTGATAHYAAEALLNAGADAVYLAVIGR